MSDGAFSYSGKLAYLTRVCRDPRLTRTATAVATVLLDYADRMTGKSYPSVARIARESRVGKTTCIRILRRLESCGHLTSCKRHGANTLYMLTGPEGDTSSELGTSAIPNTTGSISNLRVGKSGSDTGAKVVPTPDPEQRKALKATGLEQIGARSESRFSEFWKAYPKHEGGQTKCAAIWKGKKLDALADKILADIAARKADGGPWFNIERQFIPYPATYLNARRWEDEWTPAATTALLPRENASEDDLERYNLEAALRMGGGHG